MRQILARMEILAHGGVTNYQPTGAGSGADTKPPTGESKPPHEHWARRWTLAVERDLEAEQREATTITRHRKDVIEKAQADLDSYLKRRKDAVVVGESQDALESRIVSKGKGWSVSDVAQYTRCNPKFVRRARKKAGVSEVDGTGLVAETVTRGERAERAKAMRARNIPLRAIAMHLGCDVATVHRDLAA
jgi:hypothetical protein